MLSCMSTLVNFKEYMTIIPLAANGFGGFHDTVIEEVVTTTTVIFSGGPEGADCVD